MKDILLLFFAAFISVQLAEASYTVLEQDSNFEMRKRKNTVKVVSTEKVNDWELVRNQIISNFAPKGFSFNLPFIVKLLKMNMDNEYHFHKCATNMGISLEIHREYLWRVCNAVKEKEEKQMREGTEKITSSIQNSIIVDVLLNPQYLSKERDL